MFEINQDLEKKIPDFSLHTIHRKRSDLPFPNEIIFQIFSYLTLNDLLNMSHVSYHFQRISFDIADDKLNEIISKICSLINDTILKKFCNDYPIFSSYYKRYCLEKDLEINLMDSYENLDIYDKNKISEKLFFLKLFISLIENILAYQEMVHFNLSNDNMNESNQMVLPLNTRDILECYKSHELKFIFRKNILDNISNLSLNQLDS